MSYWLVMVPAAPLFAFALGRDLPGIYGGTGPASAVSLLALAARSAILTRETP